MTHHPGISTIVSEKKTNGETNERILRAKILHFTVSGNAAFADFRTGYCNSCRETADGRILIRNYIFAGEDVFAYYLETAMNLAIGVELIKMLCMHSPGTVIEVLLFAIARQVVVSHSSVTQTLTGGICNCCAVCYKKNICLFHTMR